MPKAAKPLIIVMLHSSHKMIDSSQNSFEGVTLLISGPTITSLCVDNSKSESLQRILQHLLPRHFNVFTCVIQYRDCTTDVCSVPLRLCVENIFVAISLARARHTNIKYMNRRFLLCIYLTNKAVFYKQDLIHVSQLRTFPIK